MTTIIQILLVIIIMASMVMILLSIGRLAKGTQFDDPNTTSVLKQEVKEKKEVLTHNSAFNYILSGRESGRTSSNDPSSRRLWRVYIPKSSASWRNFFSIFLFKEEWRIILSNFLRYGKSFKEIPLNPPPNIR